MKCLTLPLFFIAAGKDFHGFALLKQMYDLLRFLCYSEGNQDFNLKKGVNLLKMLKFVIN